MKLELYSNTTINVKNLKSFNGIDVLNGIFTYYPEKSSFSRKLLNLIDSCMSKIAPVSNIDQNIANYVDKAVTYLNSQNLVGMSPTPGKTLSLKVYLKFNSLGTSALQSIPIPTDKYGPERMNIVDFKINFGSNLFKAKNEPISLIINKYGLGKAVTQTLFHEVSHALEKYNNTLSIFEPSYPNPDSPDDCFQNLMFKFNVFPVATNFGLLINDFKTLSEEIYADVSSCLLMRNKEINDGFHDPIKFSEYVQDICEYRNIEHNLLQDDEASTLGTTYVPFYRSINHLTTPGIENYLIKQLVAINQLDPHKGLFLSTTEMAGENIHEISLITAKTGVARTILSIIAANKTFEKYFSSIFCKIPEDSVHPTQNNSKFPENSFSNTIKSLKQLAG